MAGKQEGKLLSFKAVEMMKPGDKDKSINDSEVSVKSVAIHLLFIAQLAFIRSLHFLRSIHTSVLAEASYFRR